MKMLCENCGTVLPKQTGDSLLCENCKEKIKREIELLRQEKQELNAEWERVKERFDPRVGGKPYLPIVLGAVERIESKIAGLTSWFWGRS